jgi:hypothetical protein
VANPGSQPTENEKQLILTLFGKIFNDPFSNYADTKKATPDEITAVLEKFLGVSTIVGIKENPTAFATVIQWKREAITKLDQILFKNLLDN